MFRQFGRHAKGRGAAAGHSHLRFQRGHASFHPAAKVPGRLTGSRFFRLMSTQSTSDTVKPTALARLHLEDGTTLVGRSFGSHENVDGEVCMSPPVWDLGWMTRRVVRACAVSIGARHGLPISPSIYPSYSRSSSSPLPQPCHFNLLSIPLHSFPPFSRQLFTSGRWSSPQVWWDTRRA